MRLKAQYMFRKKRANYILLTTSRVLLYTFLQKKKNVHCGQVIS